MNNPATNEQSRWNSPRCRECAVFSGALTGASRAGRFCGSPAGRGRIVAARQSLPSAFTLIELLVVISIIGVLAALIIPLSGVATTKMRTSRVTAELNQYVTAIEGYKLETGSYPPDSFDELKKNSPAKYQQVMTTPALYTNTAAMNTLFYELTGAIFTNNGYRTLVGDATVPPAAIQSAFNVSGIQNAARNKHDLGYKGFTIRPSQYAEISTNAGVVQILNVPVEGPNELTGLKNKKINPWYYDASTTNRHNRSTFDLWAVVKLGNTTNIIGNWKD